MNKKDIIKKEKVKEVVDFINEAIKDLWENKERGGCWKHTLNGILAIYVGWSEGYGDDKDNLDIYCFDGYALNVGVKEDITYFSDYDYINFPYYKDDGECWDSGYTIKKDTGQKYIKHLAKRLLEEYVEMQNELNKKNTQLTF